MNKRMRELQVQIVAKQKDVDTYLGEGEGRDLVKGETALTELEALQKEFQLEERKEKAGKAGVPADPEKNPAKIDAVKDFAAAARARFKNMNEGSNPDGGYTVPEDISTKINEFKDQRFSLLSLIDRETVTTMSGARTYKTRAQHTGFQQVGEGGKIGKAAAPSFERHTYAIKKFAGYLPVTNELLDDSDAAIANMLIEWLGEEANATDNAQILKTIFDSYPEPDQLNGIADIKMFINVDLAPFAGSCRIVTNSDGLQYLDTLEDANNRPLLSPDPVKPMEMYLSVGVRRIPVVVVPNTVMPSNEETGAIPFILGDLHEFMKKYDRKEMTVMTSNVAAVEGFNAFEEDMTLLRAIMRADYVVKDSSAIVYGTIVPA